MSHHLALELLSSYVDQEVSRGELRLVEDHLADCDECRERLEGLRSVAAQVRRLESVAPPPTLGAAMEYRLKSVRGKESLGTRFERGLQGWLRQPVLAPALAVILALGAILYLFAAGVGRQESGTRLVIASAPTEEAEEKEMPQSEAPSGSSSTELEVVGGMADLAQAPGRQAAELAEEHSSEFSRTDAEALEGSGTSDTRAERRLESARVADAVGARADGASGADADADEGERLAKKSELADSTGGEVAASNEASARSRAVLGQAVASEPSPTTRVVGERSFLQIGEIWVEAGLEAASVDELVDLRMGGEVLRDGGMPDEALAPFAELEHVRLRLGDRVVEVIYWESGPS